MGITQVPGSEFAPPFAPPDVEHRALRPVTPNGNDPADVPPATVGPDVAEGGDPNGVELDETWAALAGPWPPSTIRPSAWSGWPSAWSTPNWFGQVEPLCDIAWACVDLNASLIATMPPYLVGAAPSTPVSWIDNPDPDVYTSWEEFAKQLLWDYQLGEAFVLTTARYSTGYPSRFRVIPPWMVNADIVEGMRRYRIGALDVTEDILHIRYQSRIGDAHGHGPLEVGRGRMVMAGLLATYAGNFIGAGGPPTHALVVPDELVAGQAAALQAQYVQARMNAMGLPAVLSGGVKLEAMQISPEDMALVDIAKWTEGRVAVLLGVPGFLVGLPSGGDSMTYSTTGQLFDFHWRAGLRPRATAVMAALSQWLLPRGTRVEVNRDAYVQPGPLERAQAAQILFGLVDEQNRRVIGVDEIRASERLDVGDPSTLAAGVLR